MNLINFIFIIFASIFCNIKMIHSYTEEDESKLQHSVSKLFFKTKCMGNLGCFCNGPPFYDPIYRPLSFLPMDLKDFHTKFYLCHSATEWIHVEPTLESITKAGYDKNLGVQVLVHGYKVDFTGDILNVTQNAVGAILKAKRQNLLIVDFTANNKPPYIQAFANGRVVGAQLAKFIEFLINEVGLDPKNVHIIGVSLGAHIAGWAGERIPNIGRITGLEPAGPYFRGGNPKVRLDVTDANFVDVVHTNGAEFVLGGLGLIDAIGHIDFYVNGGRKQPECEWQNSIANNKDKRIEDLLLRITSCSHLRSIELFAASLENPSCKFIGYECSDYETFRQGKCKYNARAEMGINAKRNPNVKAGLKYFLTVTGTYPYCIQDKNS